MKHPSIEFSPELEEAVRSLDKSPSFVAQCLKYDIGTQVLKALEEEGMSRADLAKRLGKSRQYVTKMLKAETNFTLDSIAALSVAMGRDFHSRFARPGARVNFWQVLDGEKSPSPATTVQAPVGHGVSGDAYAEGEYRDDVPVPALKSPRQPAKAVWG